MHESDLIAVDIDAYLADHEQKGLLRFLTCGSVDDGKSTLIGRLLYDSKLIYEDHLAALHKDSATVGNAGDDLDLALLMDGLKAEREQGITIDVAYRYFSTARRKFIIADTPGHPQYTRNMATGASSCQLAVILIDARKGVLSQTKRHSFIVSLLGIRHVVVAVNKMDLVGWSRDRFDQICADYGSFAQGLEVADPIFIPMSALNGDGVVEVGPNLGWYDGPPLLELLETIVVGDGADAGSFRLPVQLVLRPNHDFRGYAGTVVSGVVRPGDEVAVMPSGLITRVHRVVTFDGDLDRAGPGRAVTLTLEDEVDVSRGNVIVHAGRPLRRAHDVDAMIVWMAEEELLPGREYLIQQGNRLVNGRCTALAHRIDIDTLEPELTDALRLNDIGRGVISADAELLFDRYRDNRHTGSFLLVDRLTNATVAAGMIIDADTAWDATPEGQLERQASTVDVEERAARYGQRPVTVFLTGLTGAGKSTIGKALERRLFDRGRATIRLDGENMRLGISRDLGFSAGERSENVRRAAEISALLNDQGLIAIAALVAPEASVRRRARELIGGERFVEVFVDTSIDVCRERDEHGLYAAADRGEIAEFPGVSAPYDEPTDADLVLDAAATTVAECVDRIIELLVGRGVLAARRNGV